MRPLLWLLTPLIYGLAFWLCGGSADYQLAIALSTLALLASAAAGAGGSIFAATQTPSGVSLTESDRAAFRGAGPAGALGEQLNIQALTQLGAPGQVIIEDLIARRIAETSVPFRGAQFQGNLAAIRNALAQGNEQRAAQLVELNNRLLSETFGSRQRAAPAQLSIENGELQINLTGPEGEQIQQIADQASTIFENRLQGFTNVSELAAQPGFGREEILGEEEQQTQLLLRLLEDDVRQREEQQIQLANRLGISPGRSLGEIQRLAGIEENRIQTTGGLERALALLGGQENLAGAGLNRIQGALSPTLSNPAIQTLELGQRGDVAMQQLAFDLALQSAQADAARSSGISNAFDAFGAGAINLIGLRNLGGGTTSGTQQPLSSTSLQQGLGFERNSDLQALFQQFG